MSCIIKWTGSKRTQAKSIIKTFPKQINKYYKPFLGGGSVLYELLILDITVNEIICSDINSDLINLWNTIKKNPLGLISDYKKLWSELNNDLKTEKQKEYFYKIRSEFNKNKNSSLFIRYNKKGDYNASFHFGRPGINPDTLSRIILHWSELLNENNVIFLNQDYINIKPCENDFVYLDPPYFNTKGMYFGNINLKVFLDWIKNNEFNFALSFNGVRGTKDETYLFPKELYDTHLYLKSGSSSFARIKQNKNILVKESLYLKIKE